MEMYTLDTAMIRLKEIAECLESGEYDLVFSSKGNFNYDKGSEDIFAFNDNYDVECWEFTQNCDQTSFLTPWPAANHPEFWEARYHAKLGELEDLQDAGLEVIYDDRKVSAGFMFSDADLLGVPVRVIVSPRNLKEGVCEIVTRDKEISMKVELDKVIETVKGIIADRLK